MEAIAPPGHSDDGVAFVVNGEVCFSRRHALPRRGRRRACRRRARLGDGAADDPRHGDPRAARPHRRDDDRPGVGAQPVRHVLARCRRGSARPSASAATRRELVVWSPDYDGKGKALVRFPDGGEGDRRRLTRRALTGRPAIDASAGQPLTGQRPCASSSPAARSPTPAVSTRVAARGDAAADVQVRRLGARPRRQRRLQAARTG